MKTRREMLQRGAGVASLLMMAGLLPTLARAEAGGYDTAAFETKSMADLMKSLGAGAPAESSDVTVTGPDIAENGAVVPIDITSNVPGTKSISLFVDKNPFPYVGTFDVAQGSEPYVHVRIKMGTSSDVRVVVAAADGKYYQAAKEVKVTIGGCGG